ncbi:MAG: aminotransferase class III-fold pyridoxal phosphate-dependent enzyme, partial [Phycisphaerales bacterium]|nr:aminotransferase class III-fold pyridoxal phosphate-dependent enzyme [Phycisphaerales bacterium]
CGIYVSNRVDEIPDNVFNLSSRINSTWGGNLVDMVRCTQFIKIIERDNIAQLVTQVGDLVIAGLREIEKETSSFTSVRGKGSLIAFTMSDADQRSNMLQSLIKEQVLALPCGKRSVRFRLPLIMTLQDANELLNRTLNAVKSMTATV